MSSDAFFDKLESIAAVSSTKAKQAIIATYTPWELEVARLALDPTISFYIAKLDKPSVTGTDQWGEAEFDLLGKLSSREFSGKTALIQVGFSLRELTPKSAELLRRVILKDLKIGAGVTLTNKAFPGLITEFPYMRCSLPKKSNMDKFKWTQGIFSQLKANGSFARVTRTEEGVDITTRQGNVYPAGTLLEIRASAYDLFGPTDELHGELLVFKDGVCLPRPEGNGILNSLLQGGTLEPGYEVRFSAWDLVDTGFAVVGGRYEVPYGTRFANLVEALRGFPDNAPINLIECRVVYSKEQAYTHYREKLALGLEGTVVKSPDAIWEDADSADQVKLKLEVDVDLKIVGFRGGTAGARTEATFGSVLCQTIDGQLEVAVSGFKRDMEAYIHEHRDSILGKIMCVRANEVVMPSPSSPLYSLFHPRFVELRNDKVEADTLQQVRDQFAAAIRA